MYNEKSNIYTITIIIFDSVRRNFDERSLSFTNEINKRIDPRPPSSYNNHDIVQTHWKIGCIFTTTLIDNIINILTLLTFNGSLDLEVDVNKLV